MGIYAIIKGNVVDSVAIADAPLDTDGIWINVTDVVPQPGRDWTYDGNNFYPAPPNIATPPQEIIIPKTEEQKLADAVAAAVAKLIADGVLKQV